VLTTAGQIDSTSSLVRNMERLQMTAPIAQLTLDGDIDRRCSAVRDGQILFKTDGSVDRRSALVLRGDLRLTDQDRPDGRSACFRAHATPTDHTSSTVLPAASRITRTGSVDARTAPVASGQVRFNQDDTIDRRCSAVVQGLLRVNEDGSPDGRSSLFRTHVAPTPAAEEHGA
jgi:hypothetical protein